jgi:hypothetical protein
LWNGSCATEEGDTQLRRRTNHRRLSLRRLFFRSTPFQDFDVSSGEVQITEDHAEPSVDAQLANLLLGLGNRQMVEVERLLVRLEQLTRAEQDPQVLGKLWELDHIGTRLRRHASNLLRLSGRETPLTRRTEPDSLQTLVRAAAGECGDYRRVVFPASIPDRMVSGPEFDDVVRILAEFMDNALAATAPTLEISVDVWIDRIGRAVLQVHDQGYGMPAEKLLATANRLADATAPVDIGDDGHIGLEVVRTFANRLGIKAELIRVPNQEHALTARIILPPHLLLRPLTAPGPADPPHRPAPPAVGLPEPRPAPPGVMPARQSGAQHGVGARAAPRPPALPITEQQTTRSGLPKRRPGPTPQTALPPIGAPHRERPSAEQLAAEFDALKRPPTTRPGRHASDEPATD